MALFLAIGGGAAFAATSLGKNGVGPKAIKPNAVGPVKIKAGAVTGEKLANGAVTSTKLAAGAVGGSKLGTIDIRSACRRAVPTLVGGGADRSGRSSIS